MDYKDMSAIGIVRLMLTDGVISQEVAAKYFPELKESEGEKIRKWIIAYLENRIMNTSITDEKDNCLNAIRWLEKQGEQNVAIQNNGELNEFDKIFDDIACKYAHNKNHEGYNESWYTKERAAEMLYQAKKALEKRGEQKLIEYPLCKTVKDKIDYYIVNHFTTDTVVKTDVNSIVKAMEEGVMMGMSEQKPAWSEEDEKTLLWIISDVKRLERDYKKADIIAKMEINWLKSLKDRVQLKQGWSEVDKMQLDAAINIVANSGHTCTSDWLKALKERVQLQNGYNPYKEVVESIAEMCKHYDTASHSGLRDFYDNVRVKCKDAKEYDSLYPQNTWKPSASQIECLSDAIKHYNSQGYTAPVLKELLEQLKNLREE